MIHPHPQHRRSAADTRWHRVEHGADRLVLPFTVAFLAAVFGVPPVVLLMALTATAAVWLVAVAVGKARRASMLFDVLVDDVRHPEA